jgi:fatty acid desaturase
MNMTQPVAGGDAGPAASAKAKIAKSAIADDMAMIRAAAELTRDLVQPNPRIYWTDFLASTFIGYGAVAAAIFAPSTALMLVAGVIAVLALYRAGSFIHELTHIRKNALPGFRLAWNALIGVPMLIPSFMYEGIHSLHHNRTKYGTVEDPEYLPLALMKPWTVPLFTVAAAFGPLAFLFRYGVVTPLSFLIPPLRKVVVEKYSGLIINPEFRRKSPEGEFRKQWAWQEGGAWIWSTLIIAAGVFGWVPLRALIIFGVIASVSFVVNQVRTLVAHLWENDGAELTVTGQFLDSVNVPPPGLLPELWAPVGLRYHALHHLL